MDHLKAVAMPLAAVFGLLLLYSSLSLNPSKSAAVVPVVHTNSSFVKAKMIVNGTAQKEKVSSKQVANARKIRLGKGVKRVWKTTTKSGDLTTAPSSKHPSTSVPVVKIPKLAASGVTTIQIPDSIVQKKTNVNVKQATKSADVSQVQSILAKHKKVVEHQNAHFQELSKEKIKLASIKRKSNADLAPEKRSNENLNLENGTVEKQKSNKDSNLATASVPIQPITIQTNATNLTASPNNSVSFPFSFMKTFLSAVKSRLEESAPNSGNNLVKQVLTNAKLSHAINNISPIAKVKSTEKASNTDNLRLANMLRRDFFRPQNESTLQVSPAVTTQHSKMPVPVFENRVASRIFKTKTASKSIKRMLTKLSNTEKPLPASGQLPAVEPVHAANLVLNQNTDYSDGHANLSN